MLFLILNGIFLCVFGFLMLYLMGLSFLALARRWRRTLPTAEAHRFAVVIPAHNEESSILRTIRSAKNVRYPSGKFDVILIADNCTDRTAEIGRREGAIVMERSDPLLKSKGYALRWCFDRILADGSGYDAVVVVDADSILSENFLPVMSGYLAQGAKVIQSKDIVEPQPGVWSAEIIRFGFTLFNHVRPLARDAMRFSAGLRGNGMCFSADILKMVPWCTYGLNEDLEYGLILLLRGIRTAFAPEATVLAVMPANPKNAESQRARWEKGRFPVIRTYAPQLIRRFLTHGSLRALDALVDLIMPPFVNLFAAAIGLTLVTFLFSLGGIDAVSVLLPYWCAVVIAGILHVFVGLAAARADRGLYKTLFFIPRYAFWKLMIYGKMALKNRSEEWIRTTREKSLKSQDSE